MPILFIFSHSPAAVGGFSSSLLALVVRCSNKLRSQRTACDFTIYSPSSHSNYFWIYSARCDVLSVCWWTRLLERHRAQLSIWRSAAASSSREAVSSHQSPGRWSPKLSLTLCISIYYHSSTLAQHCARLCLLRVHLGLFFCCCQHTIFASQNVIFQIPTQFQMIRSFIETTFCVCAHLICLQQQKQQQCGANRVTLKRFGHSVRTNRRLFDCRAVIWRFVLVCDLFGLTTSRFAVSLSLDSMKVCR